MNVSTNPGKIEQKIFNFKISKYMYKYKIQNQCSVFEIVYPSKCIVIFKGIGAWLTQKAWIINEILLLFLDLKFWLQDNYGPNVILEKSIYKLSQLNVYTGKCRIQHLQQTKNGIIHHLSMYSNTFILHISHWLFPKTVTNNKLSLLITNAHSNN